MAWQSLSGMGPGAANGGGNGGGPSGDVAQQQNQPQGTEYTLQGEHTLWANKVFSREY
jgi:striatin 1/3/4